MTPPLTRRRFLGSAAAGTALLAMPRFLAACPKPGSLGGPVSPNPFLDFFGIDDGVVRKVLARLASRGADLADVYFEHTRSNSVTMEDGIVSRAGTSVDLGVGLRCVVGDQTGFAFTEDLTIESLLAAADTAAAIASGTARVPPQHLSWPLHQNLYAQAVPWSEVAVDTKLPYLQKTEALARAADPAVEKVTVSWADEEKRILVADLSGNIQGDVQPMTRLWCQVTARKDGQTQSNSHNFAQRRTLDWWTDDRLQRLADEAVRKTMILFEARRPPAGEWPVILSAGASGILLHEAIGHGMEADFNRKGTSIFASMIGKPVAADFVTIVDDGTLPFERGSINFDDEGTPSQRTLLVEKGILRSYLHDRISARHYNVAPTGSGRRQSYRHPPLPRMRCTFMENGPHSRDEIIASVQKGIIAETFTNGQVTIGAGDFTFYIKNGWLVEGGKITAPIKDCNIIGNGPEALRAVTMVANDGKLDEGGWTCGKDGQSVPVSQGLPTVLVSKMTVGGESAR